MLVSLALLLIAGPLAAVVWVTWWLVADLFTERLPTGPLPAGPSPDIAAAVGRDLRRTP